jgi:hypothetical protein
MCRRETFPIACSADSDKEKGDPVGSPFQFWHRSEKPTEGNRG